MPYEHLTLCRACTYLVLNNERHVNGWLGFKRKRKEERGSSRGRGGRRARPTEKSRVFHEALGRPWCLLTGSLLEHSMQMHLSLF